MAVAVASTASVAMVNASTASLSLSVPNAGSYVLVGIGWWPNSTTPTSSVSVGTTASAASMIGQGPLSAGGDGSEIWMFGPVASTGAQTINGVWGVAATGTMIACSLTGMNSTTFNGTSSGAIGLSSTPSVTLTSSVNDMVFGTVGWDASVGATPMSSGSGEVIVAASTNNGEGGGFTYQVGAAGGVVLGPFLSRSAHWSMVGINIQASSGAAAGRTRRFTLLGAGL